MEHLHKAIGQIRSLVWLAALVVQLIAGLGSWFIYSQFDISPVAGVAVFIIISAVSSLLVGWVAGYFAGIPLTAFGNAIIHVSPSENAPAPPTENLKVGSEYVSSLVYQLYQIASLQDNKISNQIGR